MLLLYQQRWRTPTTSVPGSAVLARVEINLHAIEPTQLRRQHRVDGVGRPEFDVHTGSREHVFNFRASVRPVAMEAHIQGFTGKHYCPRMATMNKPCYTALREHALRPVWKSNVAAHLTPSAQPPFRRSQHGRVIAEVHPTHWLISRRSGRPAFNLRGLEEADAADRAGLNSAGGV